MSAEQRLRINSVSQKYADEVILPETRSRFGQDIAELNDLALSIAVYDADQGTSHVGGRIRPVLEAMASLSEADLKLNTYVQRVKSRDHAGWQTGHDR